MTETRIEDVFNWDFPVMGLTTGLKVHRMDFTPGVRILISKSFCGPFLVEIFKLISAGSIFCDNFHFSKFCAESQERC
jgi:hypothetical protein